MRKNDYKLAWHIRQYVKQELLDYKNNKDLVNKVKKYNGNTRGLILVNLRLKQIESVYNSLNVEDREAAELIFNKKLSQPLAEIEKGISKAAYYNVMNKVIYLTAQAMELI